MATTTKLLVGEAPVSYDRRMPIETQPLERLRSIVGQWPEVSEKLSHGAPTFWGGRKTFCNFVDSHHGDGRVGAWVKATLDMQEALVAADPEIYFVPAYVGHKGWVGVRFDRDVDWGQVEDLLESAYRSVAPKRALKQLEVRGEA